MENNSVDRDPVNGFVASAARMSSSLSTSVANMFQLLSEGRDNVRVSSFLQGGDIVLNGCVLNISCSVA